MAHTAATAASAAGAKPRPPRTQQDQLGPRAHDYEHEAEHSNPRDSGLIRRSWHAMTDLMSPFSSKALASLPGVKRPAKYTRADTIPETETNEDGERPTVRDYHAINGLPANVRVPKKIKTPVRVEPKVWFANERTWVSYLDVSIVIGALAVALFNAAKDQITRNVAYAYAIISLGIIVYGYLLYQHRITLIRRRDPGHFDQVLGPVIISVVLFTVVLVNFIVRVKDLQRKGVTIPGVMAAAFSVPSKL